MFILPAHRTSRRGAPFQDCSWWPCLWPPWWGRRGWWPRRSPWARQCCRCSTGFPTCQSCWSCRPPCCSPCSPSSAAAAEVAGPSGNHFEAWWSIMLRAFYQKEKIYIRQLHLLPRLVRLPLLPLHSVGGSPSFSLPEEEPSLCSLPPSSWSSPGSGVVSLGARCGSGVIRRGGVFSPSRTKVSRLRGLPTWREWWL